MQSDSQESSYSLSIGIQAQAGGDETGLRAKGSASLSKGSDGASSTTWTQSSIKAGNGLTVKSGNNTNIIGGQLSGESLKMDVGNDLNIESRQNTSSYDYSKSSGSVTVTAGADGASGSVSASNTKMKSQFASVSEQSGLFAGSGGYDITVGNNTDLKGAVIASTAKDASNNSLDTGTLSFSDINNHGHYDVSSTSMSVSASTTGIPTVGTPTIYNNSDAKNTTTHSAIEAGNLTVRNQEAQKQDVNLLSHDTINANNQLSEFFNKDKELETIQTIELVKDVASQIKTVGTKVDRLKAQQEVDANDDLAKKEALKSYEKLSNCNYPLK